MVQVLMKMDPKEHPKRQLKQPLILREQRPEKLAKLIL
jgi:hypothetical protein